MALQLTGITTTLVSNAIGQASNDTGALCASTKINKWSKYKPVRYASTGSIYGANGTDTAILSSIDWGMTHSSNANFVTASSSSWTYNKPEGGSSQPYRLGDFRGYNHSAQQPVKIPQNIVVNMMYTNTYDILYLMQPQSNDNLSLSDFSSCSNYYIGGVFKSGTTEFGITSPTTVSAGGSSIPLNLTSPPFNNYTENELTGAGVSYDLYHLLFASSRAQGSLLSTNTYKPLPSDDSTVSTITFRRFTGFNIDTPHISSGTTYPFTYTDLIDYQLGYPVLNFRSSGSCFIKYVLQNTQSYDITVNMTNFTLTYSKTFNRTSEITVLPTIYDSAGNNITNNNSFIIPANSTSTIIIGNTTVMALNESNAVSPVNSTKYAIVDITLKYSGHQYNKQLMINMQGI